MVLTLHLWVGANDVEYRPSVIQCHNLDWPQVRQLLPKFSVQLLDPEHEDQQ